jgi:hypothetical protein
MPVSLREGDGFDITSLDREDDHGEEGEGEEADCGQEKGCSGAQEEKSDKDDSEEDGQEGDEESGTEESGTEESGTEESGTEA